MKYLFLLMLCGCGNVKTADVSAIHEEAPQVHASLIRSPSASQGYCNMKEIENGIEVHCRTFIEYKTLMGYKR